MKFSKITVLAVLGIANTMLGFTNTFVNKTDQAVQVVVQWKCDRQETLSLTPGETLSCEGTCPIMFIALDIDGKRIGRWVGTSRLMGHFFAEGTVPQSAGYSGDGTWIIAEATKNPADAKAVCHIKMWKIK